MRALRTGAASLLNSDAGHESQDAGVPMDMNESNRVAPEGSQRLNWATFLDRVAQLADAQFRPTWDQEAHVAHVAQLMELLDLSDPAIIEAYSHYADEIRGFPELSDVYEEPDFKLSTLEFEPGEVIELHDHPDMTGVILCVSGEVEIEHFDELDEISADGNPLVKRCQRVVLTDGMNATLTASRGNIHTLRAIRFTQLLDVFTPPYNEDRITRSRWFQRADDEYEGRPDVYEAWLE